MGDNKRRNRETLEAFLKKRDLALKKRGRGFTSAEYKKMKKKIEQVTLDSFGETKK